ncbi:MAG: hypothetical protein QGM50_09230 [Anaerolineae bacterium]|nr:hypothetical protein [Anaerolineae bacterium]
MTTRKSKPLLQSLLLFMLLLHACSTQTTLNPTKEVEPLSENKFANVISVQSSGGPNAYQFVVEVASPDTGCDQFTDWWEIFNEEGELLYRRILLHSHVDEQPFVRSGGPVDIAADTLVFVRAHMNNKGYGGILMKGSVRDGFTPAEAVAGLGSGLERLPPQPQGCAF